MKRIVLPLKNCGQQYCQYFVISRSQSPTYNDKADVDVMTPTVNTLPLLSLQLIILPQKTYVYEQAIKINRGKCTEGEFMCKNGNFRKFTG